MRPSLLVTCIVALALAGSAEAALPQGSGELTVEPSQAKIGIFYHGVRLTVSSLVDSGVAVAVVASGPRSDLNLRRKARVWRTFWVPSGDVHFADIPALYFVASTSAVEDLAPDSVLTEWGVGYGSFQPVGEVDEEDLFTELIRLKESENLFRVSTGDVQAVPVAGGRQQITVTMELPANAPPAEYTIRLIGFRNHEIAVQQETTFTLTRGTVNQFLGSLARNHGLLYGILAVVIAIGAGLFVGLIFGSTKEH